MFQIPVNTMVPQQQQAGGQTLQLGVLQPTTPAANTNPFGAANNATTTANAGKASPFAPAMQPSMLAPPMGTTSTFGGFPGFNANPAAAAGGIGGAGAGVGANFGNLGAKNPYAAGAPALGLGFIGQPQPTAAQNAATLGIVGEKMLEFKMKYARALDANGSPLPPEKEKDSPLTAPAGSHANAECRFYFSTYRKKHDYKSKPELRRFFHDTMRGALWETADGNNPNPDKYVTIVDYGAPTLAKHSQRQLDALDGYSKSVDDAKALLETAKKMSDSLTKKTEVLRQNQARLLYKMLCVFRKMEVLRNRGVPLQESEARYRQNLDKLCVEVGAPGLKLQEIMTLMSQQDTQRDVYADHPSEDDMDVLFTLLDRQQKGLEHLTEILAKDSRDMDIIRRELGKKH